MSEILGVRIDSVPADEAISKARDFFYNGKQNFIFTPNPEMLVDAQEDTYFKKVLNLGSLNLSDGFGVSLVSRGKIRRVTGVDFVSRLCDLAEKENRSVFLLGSGSRDVLKKASENLKAKFPNLQIVGYHPGPKIDLLRVEDEQKIILDHEENDQAIHEIIMTAPDILLVAFGHNKQEKWIFENAKHLPTVKIAMGVGGAFDFIAGFDSAGHIVRRAPCFLRKLGLEWLYRLYRQPWRFGRILKATVMFISIVIHNKYKKI